MDSMWLAFCCKICLGKHPLAGLAFWHLSFQKIRAIKNISENSSNKKYRRSYILRYCYAPYAHFAPYTYGMACMCMDIPYSYGLLACSMRVWESHMHIGAHTAYGFLFLSALPVRHWRVNTGVTHSYVYGARPIKKQLFFERNAVDQLFRCGLQYCHLRLMRILYFTRYFIMILMVLSSSTVDFHPA